MVVKEHHENSYQHLTPISQIYKFRGFQKYERNYNPIIGFLRVEGRQGKKVLPNGPNWLSYSAGSTKNRHGISISSRFLEFLTQVDKKTSVKCFLRLFVAFLDFINLTRSIEVRKCTSK